MLIHFKRERHAANRQHLAFRQTWKCSCRRTRSWCSPGSFSRKKWFARWGHLPWGALPTAQITVGYQCSKKTSWGPWQCKQCAKGRSCMDRVLTMSGGEGGMGRFPWGIWAHKVSARLPGTPQEPWWTADTGLWKSLGSYLFFPFVTHSGFPLLNHQLLDLHIS